MARLEDEVRDLRLRLSAATSGANHGPIHQNPSATVRQLASWVLILNLNTHFFQKAQAVDKQAEEIGVLAVGGTSHQTDGTYGITAVTITSHRNSCHYVLTW